MNPRPVYILDLSKHNIKPENSVNLQKAKDEGVVALAIRATVGQWYQDPRMEDIYNAAKDVEIATTFYHVMIPNHGIAAQMSNFFRKVDGLENDWPWILDNEVHNNVDKQKITSVVQNCFKMMKVEIGENPINYTRQSWWDYYVWPWSGWKQYSLFAARYDNYQNPYLTSPWSDGKYKFRDYDDWLLWQAYADHPPNNQGSRYGVDSKSVDMDVYNGSKEDLLAYLNMGEIPEPPLTLEQRVARLEDCCSDCKE